MWVNNRSKFEIALTYPHTMRLVHIDPDWSMDTKISHVLERSADVYLMAWH
jgi:hypothetical protein